MKTSELTGAALDWAVAKADGNDEGWLHRRLGNPNPHTRAIGHYSTDWAQGGPIISREKIELRHDGRLSWCAWIEKTGAVHGPTPLIAACRCLVASKLGDEVDIPKELLP